MYTHIYVYGNSSAFMNMHTCVPIYTCVFIFLQPGLACGRFTRYQVTACIYIRRPLRQPPPHTHPASPQFRLPLKMGATAQRHLFFTYSKVENVRRGRSHQQPAVASIRQHQMAPQILYQRWLFFVGSVILILFYFCFRRCLWA